MKNPKTLSYVVWDCNYHVAWCLKYQFKILKGQEIREKIEDRLQAVVFSKQLGPRQQY